MGVQNGFKVNVGLVGLLLMVLSVYAGQVYAVDITSVDMSGSNQGIKDVFMTPLCWFIKASLAIMVFLGIVGIAAGASAHFFGAQLPEVIKNIITGVIIIILIFAAIAGIFAVARYFNMSWIASMCTITG